MKTARERFEQTCKTWVADKVALSDGELDLIDRKINICAGAGFSFASLDVFHDGAQAAWLVSHLTTLGYKAYINHISPSEYEVFVSWDCTAKDSA